MNFIKKYSVIILITTLIGAQVFADTTTTVQTTVQTTQQTTDKASNPTTNTNQTLNPNSNPNNPDSWTKQNSIPDQNVNQNPNANQTPAPAVTTTVTPDQQHQATDTDVYNAVIDAISANKQTATSGISVSVSNGVVYLSGTAATPEQADVAKSIAGSVYGVKSVESTITVTHVTK